MQNDFIITTTSNIEGCSIVSYLDTVCSNVVVGTNVFSDIAASLSDFFGGYSGSYMSKLEKIYVDAKKTLKVKAKELGANAIVGFAIDFDEISGGGKSMFMVSVSGTACIVDYKGTKNTECKKGRINYSAWDIEVEKRRIVKSINSGEKIGLEWMEFLCEYPQTEILDSLLNIYANDYHARTTYSTTFDFIEKYIPLLPEECVLDKIYEKYIDNKEAIGHLIDHVNLFSPQKVLELMDVDINLVVYLLASKKESYDESDLFLMKKIVERFDNLTDTGKYEVVKGGFLGKDKEKFICQNGHKNDKDVEYCYVCGMNMKGLTKEQVKIVNDFKERVNILEEIM